jgi:NAD(P)-dependent dehydrogenase (short-subunit alcohol dehydrogenase family)
MEEVVLITGASGGIGVALCDYLLRAGRRNLVCHYHSQSSEIGEVLRKYGLDPEERLVQADLRDEAQVAAMRTRIEERLGPVYGLVNLVGGSTNAMSWKLSAAQFRDTLDLNLTTTFLTCKEFIPGMRERGAGRIVNISSVVAFSGAAGASHYGAAKAAIVGFTRSLALELIPKNVVASVVALGYFQHGLIHSIPENIQAEIRARIPARRFGTGGEVGALVDFLLGSGGAYSSGQVYHLNGGLYS